MVFHIPKFFRTHKSVKIFTGQGVEKNNDYARNIVLHKSNKWDAASDVLKVEARQWALSKSEREKGHIINQIQNTEKKISLRQGARKGKQHLILKNLSNA